MGVDGKPTDTPAAGVCKTDAAVYDSSGNLLQGVTAAMVNGAGDSFNCTSCTVCPVWKTSPWRESGDCPAVQGVAGGTFPDFCKFLNDNNQWVKGADGKAVMPLRDQCVDVMGAYCQRNTKGLCEAKPDAQTACKVKVN